jgi:hypothetical protein
MLGIVQVGTVMLVALAAALSVAHALELPGKLYLDRQTYSAVQLIYYPGFTIAGAIAEPGGIVATALLAFLTPQDTFDFWLVLIALAGMVVMVAIYWIVVHPVNRFWLEGQHIDARAAGFFAFGAKREGWKPDWADLRNRWEYGHVARAIITSVSLLALVVSLVV